MCTAACACNTDGTVGGASDCDTMSGQCVCKANVNGDASRVCDMCKEGFFNLTESNPLGCQGTHGYALAIVGFT